MHVPLVYRTCHENHRPLKGHGSVSKRISHVRPWKDYQSTRQGWPSLFLVTYFPKMSLTNKCSVSCMCSIVPTNTMGPKCMLLTCHFSKDSWPLWFILHYWQVQKIWLLWTYQAFKNWSKFPVTPLYGAFLFDKKTFQVLSYRLERDIMGHGVSLGKHLCHEDNYLLYNSWQLGLTGVITQH